MGKVTIGSSHFTFLPDPVDPPKTYLYFIHAGLFNVLKGIFCVHGINYRDEYVVYTVPTILLPCKKKKFRFITVYYSDYMHAVSNHYCS